MNRITAAALSVLFAIGTVACSDSTTPLAPGPEDPGQPSGLIVSDPIDLDASDGSTHSFVYVSALSGTFRGGLYVTLQNETRGGRAVSVPLASGGFDPIAIEAFAWDEVSRTVDDGTGQPGMRAVTRVPFDRRPEIVRTSPGQAGAGVAVDGPIIVVFSEPIDEATLAGGSINLTENGTGVDGTVQPSADRLSAQLTPFDPLRPKTAYSLVIDARIRDLDGERLLETSVISFVTGFGDEPPEMALDMSLEVSFMSYRDGNAELYRSRMGGSNVVRLTTNDGFDGEASWSPDGSKLAFVSARQRGPNGALLDEVDIYVMNADGSGIVRMTTTGSARQPSWSPDGRMLAYEFDPYPYGAGDIAIMDVGAGEASRRFLGLAPLDASRPAWSPDGTRIAFGTGDYGKGTDILAVTLDGSSMTTLLGRAHATLAQGAALGFSGPVWSPDGRRVAALFCRGSSDECEQGIGIVTGTSDGSDFGYLVDDAATWPYNLAWSPDGAVIAFERGWCDGPLCGADIGYVTLDRRRSGTIVTDAHDPAWRPKGQ